MAHWLPGARTIRYDGHTYAPDRVGEWLSGPIPEPGSGEPAPPADSGDKTPFTVNDHTRLNNLCHAVRIIRGRIKGLEAEPDSLHNRITENVGILVGRIDKVQAEVESLRHVVSSHIGPDHPTSRQVDEILTRLDKLESASDGHAGWVRAVAELRVRLGAVEDTVPHKLVSRLQQLENTRPKATPSREDLEIEVDSALEVIAREIESGEWAGSHPAERVRRSAAELVRSIRDRLVKELTQ
jgi:hypothetical protein